MYLNTSSDKVFQTYYFSLTRLFEPNLLQLLLKRAIYAISSVQTAQCLPKHPGVHSGSEDPTPLRSPSSYKKYFLPCLRPISECNSWSSRVFGSGLLGFLEPLSLLKMALDNSAKTFLHVMWWVKWTQSDSGSKDAAPKFSLALGISPTYFSRETKGGKWKGLQFMALNETCTGPLSSWCEAFPKKVLFPWSGALCAQKGQGCRHHAVVTSHSWGYSKRRRSVPPLRAPHVETWMDGMLHRFLGDRLPPE